MASHEDNDHLPEETQGYKLSQPKQSLAEYQNMEHLVSAGKTVLDLDRDSHLVWTRLSGLKWREGCIGKFCNRVPKAVALSYSIAHGAGLIVAHKPLPALNGDSNGGIEYGDNGP
ncbi:hypothetical protein F5Y18DRAFT_426614 [Xylariaceae sp. FL1019]|nr:hypothetical protein F5Y18DRAFT_426614 [Xylariaceae sp. FL1019]